MELVGQEFNPHTGAFEQFYADHEGNYATRDVADLTPLMEDLKEQRNNGNNGFTKSGNLRKIAEIDVVTQLKLLREHNIDMNRWNYEDQKNFKRWLSNSENKYFRTHTGQI